jgi:hypothetical protein
MASISFQNSEVLTRINRKLENLNPKFETNPKFQKLKQQIPPPMNDKITRLLKPHNKQAHAKLNPESSYPFSHAGLYLESSHLFSHAEPDSASR